MLAVMNCFPEVEVISEPDNFGRWSGDWRWLNFKGRWGSPVQLSVWERIIARIPGLRIISKIFKRPIREAELSVRIRSINDGLTRIQEQKARLAEEWVMMSMDPAKCREIQRSLGSEETRLNSIKGNNGPVQIEELEHTQGLLRFWENQVNSMVWNTENEDGSMVRTVDKPHRTVLTLISTGDKDISNAVQFPAVKRELLDILQVRLVAYEDRVEIKTIFPAEAISRQLCTSPWQCTLL